MTNIIEPDTKFTPRITSNLEPQIDWAHASVILGRDRQAIKEFGLEGTMNLGILCEHQTTGASLFGYKVLFDNKFPHIIFICGKRGSGKSYTLGVIVEELGRSNSGIGTIVVDPLGTFLTMKNKNKSQKADTILPKYGLYPRDFKNIRVLAPVGFYEDMRSSVDGAFSIAVSDLTVDDWCLVFDINRFKTQGLLIGDVLDKIINGYDAIIGDLAKK
ncbi:MAG: helicase HerA domain-containing protein, partial [Candidatus Thorarchaeota archaeon]